MSENRNALICSPSSVLYPLAVWLLGRDAVDLEAAACLVRAALHGRRFWPAALHQPRLFHQLIDRRHRVKSGFGFNFRNRAVEGPPAERQEPPSEQFLSRVNGE